MARFLIPAQASLVEPNELVLVVAGSSIPYLFSAMAAAAKLPRESVSMEGNALLLPSFKTYTAMTEHRSPGRRRAGRKSASLASTLNSD